MSTKKASSSNPRSVTSLPTANRKVLVLTNLGIDLVDPKDDIVYLGPWCFVPKARELSDKEYLEYHWNDRRKLERDAREVGKLFEAVLEKLSGKFNKIHGLAYSDRFWRITIGPWLHTFLAVLFDRWEIIEQARNSPSIAAAMIAEPVGKAQVAKNTTEFDQICATDWWNLILFSELLRERGTVFELDTSDSLTAKCRELASSNEHSSEGRPTADNDRQSSPTLSSWALDVIGIAVSRNPVFLYRTYLSRADRIRLDLSLGQLPIGFKKVEREPSQINWTQREWMLGGLDETPLQRFIANRIAEFIPKIFIEGFPNLCKLVERQRWPRNPRRIFTSNAHYRDETFKLWAAQQVERGAKLIIGQHGGGVATMRFAANLEHERTIADRLLVWGKPGQSSRKDVQVGVIKRLPAKSKQAKTSGEKLTLVTYAKNRYTQMLLSYPLGPDWFRYHLDSVKFVDQLCLKIRQETIVRLYRDNDVSQRQLWEESFPQLLLSDQEKSLDSILHGTRILVCTYNGATILESLASNIPTVIFWDSSFFELTKFGEEQFAKLHSAKIFFTNPVDAANHVNSTWSNVDEWWFHPQVQDTVSKFCEALAWRNPRLVRSLRRILRGE